MKKVLLSMIVMLFATQVAFCQDSKETEKTWTHGGIIGFNISQSHFDNWTSGGQDNINFLGILKYKMNYMKDKSKWDNDIDLALGYSYFDVDKKPLKTDDHFNLSSLYGYDVIKDKLFITANLTFKTQLAEGFNYKEDSTTRISKFMAPGYITLGLGAQWTPAKYFSLNLAPVTGKLTIVNDQKLADEGAFGVKTGNRTRLELGAQLTAKFEYEILKNITFNSKLIVFYDYLHKNKDFNALGKKYDCPIDFDWDNALIMKINDYFNCNITAHLIYDEDIKPITGKSFFQFKEVLSIGLSYNIP